ncbi:MAG: winged helix DNA-binding domain-containing protein [Microbacteriaceae bacterium]
MDIRELSADQARQLRMEALLLAGNPHLDESPAQSAYRTVKHLQALQGQDFGASRYALGVRIPDSRLFEIDAAFNAGLLVRSWPMRGTVHAVAAEDIGWMQGLTNHRVLANVPKRREFIGLPDRQVELVASLTEEYLRAGVAATRDELSAVWVAGGAEPNNAWRYHLIWYLSQIGLITMGPIIEGKHSIVLASEWIRNPRRLEGEAALVELALGYQRGRGPVTTADFAWWAGLTQSEAKKAFALAEFQTVLIQGIPHFVQPANLETFEQRVSDSHAPLLLGAFDEHLLGYKIRDLAIDAAHFAEIVPGKNGVFKPTIVSAGQVVGTWNRASRQAEALSGREAEFHRVFPQLNFAALDRFIDQEGLAE